jgi:hypothetical protein
MNSPKRAGCHHIGVVVGGASGRVPAASFAFFSWFNRSTACVGLPDLELEFDRPARSLPSLRRRCVNKCFKIGSSMMK